MRFQGLFLLFFIISWLAAAAGLRLLPQSAPEVSPAGGFHLSGFFEIKEQIQRELLKDNSVDLAAAASQVLQIGITSHHLPTALPFIADFYRSLAVSQGPRGAFVILAPDHLERCRSLVSLSQKPYLTPFGPLPINDAIVRELKNKGFVVNETCFEGEHAIGVQAIFIKYLFPEATFVPLLFSSAAGEQSLDDIIEVLTKEKDKMTVVASVDFSHYHFYDQARRLDAASREMLKKADPSFFDLVHVDSPPAVKLIIRLAKEWAMPEPLILEQANSFDFTRNPRQTTGYINALFGP